MAYRVADSLEQSPDEVSPERQEHDRVLRQLVGWFEEAEQSTQTSREKAERDRDYYDGKQWTEEEAAELKKRGQPVIALNVIRARVNYHLGVEKKQRRDPKAFGRGPNDMAAAEVATEALRYAMERTDYHTERSRVWENIKVEGCGALECSMVDRPDGNKDVKWKQIPWDRFFADPHSARGDFEDARYIGQVKWMDEEEVLDEYPDADAAVEASLQGSIDGGLGLGNTYEDRPRWQMWADPKRKRVRVVQVWYLERGQWMWAEFCKGGILAGGPSPYQDDEGESLCGIIAESCYIDRENARYGEVRDLVDPQDEVNKRRSKALHAVNTNVVITEQGAIPDGDVEKARREANRPDGFIVVAPNRRFEIDRNTDMAQGQAMLLTQAMAHIMSTGPNAALLGKGTEDQSGRAIQAQQQGGMIELGDGLDVLRRMDWRVFKFTWFAIKQYWSAPMFIRITEDPEAPQWLGINQPQMDPMTGQMAVDPMTGRPQMENQLAQADVDIIIEDAPDVPTLEGETFAAVMDVLGKGAPPPVMKVMIELHPGLKASVKKKLNKFIDEMMQAQGQQEQAKAQAEQMQAQVEAQAKQAEAAREDARLQFEMQGGAEQGRAQLEREKLQLEREQMMLEAQQSSVETEIKRAELAVKMKELELKMRELDLRNVEVRQGAEIERARLADGQQARAEQRQSEPKPQPQQNDRSGEAIGKGLEALAQAMSRPRSVQRGPDGRVAGIE